MAQKIKLKKLISLLEKALEKNGNLEVRIDNDPENGWYDLEKVKVEYDKDFKEKFVNLKSSNEM